MRNNVLIHHAILLLCLSCMQANDQNSDAQDAENVVVQTEYGKVVGKRMKRNYLGLEKERMTDVTDQFYGIPFAKPPIGPLRFKSPEPLERWKGEREAFKKAHSCSQSIFPGEQGNTYEYQSEDCLYLNVFAPFQPQQPTAKHPVMLYIHGGSYESGTGNIYDGRVLSTLGVVVVTFNYRLGAVGFLLSGDSHLAGNYGLEDQVMVMKWLKKNIAGFGGDPDNVMLVGHSVGAALVGIHMTIDESKGLFHSVVAQSGSASASYSIYHDDMGINFKEYVFNVSSVLGCGYDGEGGGGFEEIKYEGAEYERRMTKVVECLRKVPVHKFINRRHRFPLFDKLGVEFRPYLDGKLIKQTIHEAIMTGNFYNVPFVTGVVEREFEYFMDELLNKTDSDYSMEIYLNRNFDNDKRVVDLLRFNYIDWPTTLAVNKYAYQTSKSDLSGLSVKSHTNFSDGIIYYRNGEMLSDFNMVVPTLQMADMLSKHSSEVYFYYFSEPNSYHSIELSYLFGTPFGADSADEDHKINFNSSLPSNSPIKTLSKTIMTLWTSFAKNKKLPSVADNVTWPLYDSKTRKYLNFSLAGVNVFSHLEIETTFLWNELVPNLFPETSQNALGPGGSIVKAYPSLLEGGEVVVKARRREKKDNLNTILTILLVLAGTIILVLLVVVVKLRRKTHKLEQISKLYNSEHVTNL